MTPVNWTEAALADARAAEEFVGRRSAGYGRGLVARLFDRADTLADHPLIGAPVPEYADDTVREVFEHPYRLVYRVYPDRVDVVAVVHASRRMPRGL